MSTTHFHFGFDIDDVEEENGGDTPSSQSLGKPTTSPDTCAVHPHSSIDDENLLACALDDTEKSERREKKEAVFLDVSSMARPDLQSIKYDEIQVLQESSEDLTDSQQVIFGRMKNGVKSLKRIRSSSFMRNNDPRQSTSEVCIIPCSNVIHAASFTHDVIPGEYEGGLKTWECSIDLCCYIMNHPDLFQQSRKKSSRKDELNDGQSSSNLNSFVSSTEGVTALELGCGHGLPGISVLSLHKNNSVLFMDYNDYVLQEVTWPNIHLNHASCNQYAFNVKNSRVAMAAGDWLNLTELLRTTFRSQQTGSDSVREDDTKSQDHVKSRERNSFLPSDGKFCIILAAETMYTESAARETAILLKRHLCIDRGFALVATKRYYFGVGGGSDAFRRYADIVRVVEHKKCYGLRATTLTVFDNGAGNIREILHVTLEALESQ